MIPEVSERKAEIEKLCRRLGVSRLELFGSAATGGFRAEDSDLDLLVEFQSAAPSTGYADRYFELLESLELLFDRPVDLVVGFAIRNPYFREAVDRTKALLYAA
jgi:predicted nucleotidyltransferase